MNVCNVKLIFNCANNVRGINICIYLLKDKKHNICMYNIFICLYKCNFLSQTNENLLTSHIHIYTFVFLFLYIYVCTHPRLGFFGIFQKYNHFHCRHLRCCSSVPLLRCCLYSTESPARHETYYHTSEPFQLLVTLVMPIVSRIKLYMCRILCC